MLYSSVSNYLVVLEEKKSKKNSGTANKNMSNNYKLMERQRNGPNPDFPA
jgi:hypothetical protein